MLTGETTADLKVIQIQKQGTNRKAIKMLASRAWLDRPFHTRALGHDLATMEATQERAKRQPDYRRRDAPDRRHAWPRHRGHHLPHAIHLVSTGPQDPPRRPLYLARKRS